MLPLTPASNPQSDPAPAPAPNPDDRADTLAARARWYAEHDWPVFPLVPRNKTPLTPNGFKNATTDCAQIVAWWRQWPDANIGTPVPDGHLVVDVDIGHGGTLDQLGALPTTVTAKTGGGGWHLWTTVPPDVKLTGKFRGLTGIDVRKGGNYVVLPPSVHPSGTTYQWERPPFGGTPMAALPTHLLDRVREHPRPLRPLCPLPSSPAQRMPSPVVPSEEPDEVEVAGICAYWLDWAMAQCHAGGAPRNETGFKLAQQLRDNLIDQTVAEGVLLDFAARVTDLGDHPYTDDEALGSLRQAYSRVPREPSTLPGSRSGDGADTGADAAGVSSGPTGTSGTTGTSRADAAGAACVRLLLDGGEPFRDPSRQPYIDLDLGDGERRTIRLWDAEVAHWLHARYFDVYGVPVGKQTVEAAIATVQGKAMMGQVVHPVYTRLAPDALTLPGLYLDLGTRERAVHVTPTGWTVVDHPPVKFQRPTGYLPLPEPLHTEDSGATLAALRPFLNVGADETTTEAKDRFRLMVGWLLGTLMPLDGDYPLLALSGPKGSAKTTTMRYLRSLVDPHEAVENGPPDKEEDLRLQAAQTWVTTFDNLAGIKGWFSDALCRLSTGMAAGKRKFYHDEQRIIYHLRRPVLLNGIHELARNDDLMQRTLRVKLTPLPDEARQVRGDLDRAFEAARPRLLGALLDAVVVALREREDVKKVQHRLPRLADWYIWVLAAERSGKLGWEATEGDDFAATLWRNQDQGRRTALAHNPVADALLRFLSGQQATTRYAHDVLQCHGHTWTGTMLELQRQLTQWAACAGYAVSTPAINWPATPQAMTARLEAAKADLEAEGVTFTRHTPTHSGRRRLTLTYTPPKRAQGQGEDEEDDGLLAA